MIQKQITTIQLRIVDTKIDRFLLMRRQDHRDWAENSEKFFRASPAGKKESRVGIGRLGRTPRNFFIPRAYFGTPYAKEGDKDPEPCNETKGGFSYESG